MGIADHVDAFVARLDRQDAARIAAATGQQKERSVSVRAMFVVQSVKQTGYRGNPDTGREIVFSAATACNKTHATPEEEDACESHSYSKATPSGTLTMQVSNPRAYSQFTPGDAFYLDFTPVPA